MLNKTRTDAQLLRQVRDVFDNGQTDAPVLVLFVCVRVRDKIQKATAHVYSGKEKMIE
jgi:hypothetical protein